MKVLSQEIRNKKSLQYSKLARFFLIGIPVFFFFVLVPVGMSCVGEFNCMVTGYAVLIGQGIFILGGITFGIAAFRYRS